MLPRKVFGDRMKEARTRLGVSQASVARYLTKRLDYKVDASALSRIEGADRKVRLDEAVLIAEVLQVPLAELIAAPGDVRLARIDEVRASLRGAEAARDDALAEMEGWRDKVAELEEELRLLEDEQEAEEKAEIEKELLDDLNSKLP